MLTQVGRQKAVQAVLQQSYGGQAIIGVFEAIPSLRLARGHHGLAYADAGYQRLRWHSALNQNIDQKSVICGLTSRTVKHAR